MQNATDGVNGVVYQGHLNRIKAHDTAESRMGMVTEFTTQGGKTMKILFLTMNVMFYSGYVFVSASNLIQL